ncbi:MAG: NADH-quinone oxidoreductase subunit NuoN [Steroidobacteraceae bacterium]
MQSALTLSSLLPVIPEIYLTAAICVALLVGVFKRDSGGAALGTLTLVLLGIGAILTARFALVGQSTVLFDGLYIADPVAGFLKLTGFVAVGVALLYSQAYRHRHGIRACEYDVLVLTALLGIFIMVSAGSLLSVYLGVELLSLSLYALVAADRKSGVAAEAAIKYFVLGAIASGALLYGMSMLYGLTGTLDLHELANLARDQGSTGLLIGIAFVIVAVAFKFGAVPFHMWVPDVYEGAPTTVTLLIASAPKIGSFALAYRLLAEGLSGMPAAWGQMLMAVAVLSLVVGNVVAIAQSNLRRMLAYSTVANVGFILLGFVAGSAAGYQAALYYTVAYILTTLGSFGIVLLASSQASELDSLEDYKGLARREPLLAALMAALMLSTAGVPPFVGFWAKLWVLQSLVAAGHIWLAGFAVFTSVIGAYYYLRVIWFMYFEQGVDKPAGERSGAAGFVITLNTLAVLVLGLLPNTLLALCQKLLP